MMNGMSRAACERWCRRHRVRLAVVFGSTVTGRRTAHSDLDLAFWLEGKRIEGQELVLTNALMRDLHRNDVDVVVLNHAAPLLQWQIVSTGRLVYERQPGQFHQLQVQAMKRYQDSRKLLDLQELFLTRFLKRVKPAW